MNQDLLLLLIIVLVLASLLRVWTRRRAAARASRQPQARPAGAEDTSSVALPSATWAPPRYEAARDAHAGPSLRVGINIIRLREDGLLVSWNATNNGSLPVAVQWGAPEVTADDDLLQLRYTQEPTAPFSPSEVRTYQPGEILSRSATVPRDAIGREPAGMRVTVAVGYGNAEEYDAACADQGAYLDWQRVAVSPPRIVPRG